MGPAVVISQMGEILELGVRDVLRRAGIAIIGDAGQADVALIDLDRPGARDRADQLLHTHMGLVVIGCSSMKDEMLTIHLGGDPVRSPFTPANLRSAVRRAAAARTSLTN